MTSQKVFQAGNSWAVTIPRSMAEKYGLEPGLNVIPYPVADGILYKPVRKTGQISKEFDTWLKKTAKKYAPALRRLASR